jgi:hypothetical protein
MSAQRVSGGLVALLVVLALVGQPVAAQTSGDVDTPIVNYDGQPSFVVELSDADEIDSLEAWAEASGQFDIVSHEPNSTTAVVSGPRWRVQSPGPLQNTMVALLSGTPLADAPLADRGYIESVTPNYQHSVPDQPDGMTVESFDVPTRGFSIPYLSDGPSASGIAFSENATTIGDVHEHVGADGLSEDGSGVDVAVLDTGLNVRNATSDPLYGDRIVAARNFVSDEDAISANDFQNVSDGSGHGSWVASSIAADATNNSYDGIAPDANLLVAKTLADDGSGSTADITDGIRWAERQDADVLSMSLGSPVYDDALADALRDFLSGNGTVAYIAVGNSRMARPAQIASPSDVPETGVIGVAATNASQPSTAGPAYFSQTGKDSGYLDGSNGVTTGEGPDIAAPGMSITVPTYSSSGIRTNSTLSGTSMATPIAAGVGALGLDANPGLENETAEFAELVESTTTVVPLAGVTEVGDGMVNATKLVTQNESGPTQRESRTSAAQGRDEANGLGLYQYYARIRSYVGA